MTQQKYHGSCQCGAVDFTAELDLEKVVTCNCSRCQRLGSVLTFTTGSAFTLNSGADSLTEYLFNKRVIAHQFCKVCGIETFARGTDKDGAPTVAVNVNCLDGVDPRALKAHHYDGAAS